MPYSAGTSHPDRQGCPLIVHAAATPETIAARQRPLPRRSRQFWPRQEPLMSNFPISKTDAEWRAILADKGAEPGAFEVTRRAHTERPFTGKYEQVWADGSYHCICCGNRL